MQIHMYRDHSKLPLQNLLLINTSPPTPLPTPLPTPPPTPLLFFKDLIVGAVSGIVRTTIGYPFDQIKIYLQMNRSRQFSVTDCIQKIWKEDKVRGFYRGSSLTFLLSSTQMAGNFMVFNSLIKKLNSFSSSSSLPLLPLPFQYYMAGVGGGLVHGLLTSPVDMVRIHQLKIKSPSIYGSIQDIYRLYGWKGYLKGMVPTLYRDGLGMGFYFTVSHSLNDYFKSHFTTYDHTKNLVFGAVAGCAWWGLTYPFDLTKTLMQKDISVPPKYPTIYKTWQHIYQENKCQGFVRGLNICLIRAAVVNSVMFCCMDYVRKRLKDY